MNEETTPRRGQIYDVGYRPFEGPYQGRGTALAGLVWDDAKRGLGIKQGTFYKVIFVLLLLAEVATVGVLLATGQFFEQVAAEAGLTFNPYSALFDFVSFYLLFFSALVVPLLICIERRYGVYPLYVSRPIRAFDYLLAKGASVALILGAVALGPALIMLGAKVVLASQPVDYLSSHVRDLGALLASSGLFALFYASLAMAVSSLTTNRGYAAGGLIGGVLVLIFVPQLLFLITENAWFTTIDVSGVATAVKNALFGTLQGGEVAFPTEGNGDAASIWLEPLSAWIYLVETLVLIGGCWIVIGLQYRREVR